MTSRVVMGCYVDGLQLQIAYLGEGMLHTCEPRALSESGRNLYWFRTGDDELDYYTAQDLLGVAVEGSDNPRETIRSTLQQARDALADRDMLVERICLAFPSILDDAVREHVLAALQPESPELGLIDPTMAAAYAYQAQHSGADGLTAVLVCGPASLEASLIDIRAGELRPLKLESSAVLSDRALHRHLLQRILDRLPEFARSALAAADPHDVLSGLVERVATAKSLLARVPEIKFPIQEGDLKGVNVVLSREDLREFFSRHQQEMSGLVNRLRPHAGTVAGPLRSVVVVCGDGEFAPLNELLQDLLGEAEPLPTTVIADGAALAARTIKPSRRAKQSPVLTLATRFVKRHSDVLKLAALSTTAAAADAAPAGNWEIAARQLIAAGETNEARQYLQRVIYRATQILESLPGGASRASQAPAPESQRSAIWTPDKGRLFTAEPAAPPRPQPLAEAEAILENARQILERSRGSVEKIRDAVGLSHLADQRVAGVGIQEKHHILLGVVDVHCRAAELLEGPQNFDVAIEKLQCALNHRQNDERVRDRLAARYQAQARYLKDQGEVEQARNMLRMAAKYAFDDTEIWEELDQLDSLG